MSLTRSSGVIQRHWRGWKVRSELPRLRSFQGANLNAGLHLDRYELNYLHPFWSSRVHAKTRTITFNDAFSCLTFSCLTKEKKNSIEKTDYAERGERPLCKTVKIVEAACYGNPLFPIFESEKDKLTLNAIDAILLDINEELKAGRSYRFNNPSSIKISPTYAALHAISLAHLKFRYFYGFTTPTPPVQVLVPHTQEPPVSLAPLAPAPAPDPPPPVSLPVRQLYTQVPPVQVLVPLTTPTLQRQPSRSLAYIRLQASLP